MNVQTNNVSENNFEQCIKCTICTVYCPVVPVNPLYPGPKQAGPDGERLRLKKGVFFDEALKYCLNCKRCEVVCPSGVRVGDIIQSARLKYSKHKPSIRDMILASTDLVGSTATKMAPIVNPVVSSKPAKALMDGILKIDHRRTFPAYASETFEHWFRKKAAPLQSAFAKQVGYFHGCYVNYNYPKLGQDFVKIMNAVGYGVSLVDKEKCCGVALISNGMKKTAKKHAEHNTAAIAGLLGRCEAVLSTSSTCTMTIRDEYPHLLGTDNSAIRDGVLLAVKFLYSLVDWGEIRLVFRKDFSMTAAYHAPCHLEKLGWSIFSIGLLKMIPGLKLTVLDSNCCGIAGTYGFKKENYEVSQSIGQPLFEQIRSLSPDVVATDCETCKWQIEMSTGFKVMNPVSILADALDVEATVEENKKAGR